MTRIHPQKSRVTAPNKPASPRATGVLRAEVIDCSSEDFVLVRLHRRTPEEVLRAELAVPHYEASLGDRVLVQEGEDCLFVIGVLGPARRRPRASLLPGLTATFREGEGVELRAIEGDLTLSAKGRVALRADVEIAAVSPEVRVEATAMLVEAGRHELSAARVVERAGDVYRHAEGLAETTAGRARTIVTGDNDLCAGRTTITSDEDTVVDGERVLLG